jgi:hypothetical protein
MRLGDFSLSFVTFRMCIMIPCGLWETDHGAEQKSEMLITARLSSLVRTTNILKLALDTRSN